MLITVKLPLVIMAFALLCSTGCGAPSAPYRTPDHWAQADAYGAYDEHESSPPEPMPYYSGSEGSIHIEHNQLAKTESAPSGFVPYQQAPTPRRAPSLAGSSCLAELKRRGVAHVSLPALKGVENPVEVRGQLGGVEFWANDGRRLQLDCRLAVALDELGSVMSGFGVRKIRYSGAYVYRTTRTGRLSHHALGLAIDLHEFEVSGDRLSVKEDFRKNAGCTGNKPTLNSLSCKMREQALFEEFLTPDYNADHRDHLHISVPKRKTSP